MPLAASQQKMLRQFPLFAGCNSAQHISMIQALEPYVLQQGKYLTDIPYAESPLCFLLAGEVEYRTSSGAVFMTCKAPYLFFSGLPYENNDFVCLPKIYASSPAAVFTFISEEAVASAVKSDSVFTLNLLRLMSQWNRSMQLIACRFSASSPSVRLAMFLRQQSQNGIIDVSSGISNLSRALDISRATLYRSLSELESMHLIQRTGKSISIPSAEHLDKFIAKSSGKQNPHNK